jgi:LysM repeat protein
LLAIGLRYGLPWESIAAANGLNELSILQIGQTLRIPGSGTPLAPVPEVPTEEYTVQPNDTLFTIGARRGLYWDEVAAVNGFGEHTVLQIGQVIKVPVIEEEVAAETTLIVDARPAVVRPIGPEQSPTNFDNYSLMAFDPANADAAQAKVSSTGVGGPLPGEAGQVTQVAMALSPGMGATAAVLEAHAASAAMVQESTEPESTGQGSVEAVDAVEAAATDTTLYQVQSGDTIISIATNHGLAWGALLELNGMSENSLLQPGQMIRLR